MMGLSKSNIIEPKLKNMLDEVIGKGRDIPEPIQRDCPRPAPPLLVLSLLLVQSCLTV